MTSPKYVPALDGVRCYAVLLVVLYHFHDLAVGWIGVQVFFVLSGFLITRILLDAKDRYHDTYFRRFYARRTLRIVPLYALYLAVVAIAYQLTGHPAAFGGLWGYLVSYTSNFSRMGVADRGGEFFVHFWSLAVEEQFYLVWPLLVFVISRSALRRTVLAILILTPLVRLVAGEWMFAHGFAAERVARVLETMPFTQFDSFAAGAALVVLDAHRWRHTGRLSLGALALWTVAGAVMLTTTRSGLDHRSIDSFGHTVTTANYYHVWGSTLTNLTAAAVILAVLHGAAAPLFQNRVAVYLGKISYGIYVLHLPARFLLGQRVAYNHFSLAGIGVFLAYFAVVVAVASLSYWAVELPFLRLKDRRPTAVRRVPSAAPTT